MAFLDLMRSEEPEHVAEFQWRLGIPISTIILAILAVPLSRSQPRAGRYGRLTIGLLVFIIYLNMMSAAKAWIEQSTISPAMHAVVRPWSVGRAKRLSQETLQMTGILSQYMMRTILASTALVLVVLLALAGLFEFIAELDDTRGDYQTAQAILYTALRLPNLAFEMLPIAALIGSLLGLGALAGNSEIIVMRSAGLSVRELAGMVALSGGLLLVLTGLLGEFIGPPLDFYARNMRLEARYQKDDSRLGDEAWVKDGSTYLHLETVNPEFDFGSLYIYRFDDDRLESIAVAENSGIDENDNWILENLRETHFYGDGVQVLQTSRSVESSAKPVRQGIAELY